MALAPSPTLLGKEGIFADLPAIDYSKILLSNAAEAAKLYEGCSEYGYFYLDLSGDETRSYLEIVATLFAVSKDYFAKPLDEKMKDQRDDVNIYNICGYKPLGPLGRDAGNAKQKSNGSECMRVPADLVHIPAANTNFYFPAAIKDHQDNLSAFVQQSHTMANCLLSHLSNHFGLEGDQRFEALHRPSDPSTSDAVLQHYPSTDLPPGTSMGHFSHTDSGSITIVFSTDWGLQVFSPKTETWEWVAPREKCAIVFVGDSLKFLSQFKLKSTLHRVIPWQQPWAAGSRYSIMYFLRSSNETRFTDSEGVKWKAVDWLNKKFQNYRAPHEEQEKSAVSTGKKGFVGLWEEQRV